MVGILVSFWDGPFSGAMLVSGSVVALDGNDMKSIAHQVATTKSMKRHCANIKYFRFLGWKRITHIVLNCFLEVQNSAEVRSVSSIGRQI